MSAWQSWQMPVRNGNSRPGERSPRNSALGAAGEGGLLAGIACWIKAHTPNTRLIGVWATGAPALLPTVALSSPEVSLAVPGRRWSPPFDDERLAADVSSPPRRRTLDPRQLSKSLVMLDLVRPGQEILLVVRVIARLVWRLPRESTNRVPR
jgi:hypothetical protein